MYPISFHPRFECQVNKFYLDSRDNNISTFTSIINYLSIYKGEFIPSTNLCDFKSDN